MRALGAVLTAWEKPARGGERAPPAQPGSPSQELIYGHVFVSAAAHGSPLCLRDEAAASVT